jgi:hypothetical protein
LQHGQLATSQQVQDRCKSHYQAKPRNSSYVFPSYKAGAPPEELKATITTTPSRRHKASWLVSRHPTITAITTTATKAAFTS